MVINSVDYIGEDTDFPGNTGQVVCLTSLEYGSSYVHTNASILKSSLAKIVELDSTT